ncbi:vitamin K epoxide reductase family protein [Williamsia herbipolensis]|uniref:vitamin K epoxide reductase family protein n=1 Tax=Williamsia herbipolensis TaxID=1603258 RepID=UPI000B1E203F|nr:vitamin K epoxide reductase family protein [Williamsia herbipolensis]
MSESITASDQTPADLDDHSPDPIWAPRRATAIVLLICGAIGLLAAVTLTIERFKLLEDPSYRPSCSLNPVLSCGSVMVTKQAQFFGFPNPLIGIGAFSVVLVIGVLVLARVDLPVWFWGGLTADLAAGMVFVVYLIVESLYRINALCPYCMAVWTVTPILLVIAAQTTARLGSIPALWRVVDKAWFVLIAYYIVVVALIGERFWYYWSTLL